ncbi:TROVE domain-containing protein [Salininema proteolyticum]|uniref:TROVE domain-containing protein n=1 Tax=Salininema proteolyticum TaxID=1607685 RepID=A0ABV8TZW8_9ACTN
MAKFNKKLPTGKTSPVRSKADPSATTHEGGAGHTRDAKSELFLLAVTNMVGEDTFYEAAGERDERYRDLIAAVAVADPDWTARFTAWLRSEAGMRSASVVAALEAARAMVEADVPGGRQIVADALKRADEPGEALAYWTHRYGRKMPKPVKRGIADAAKRLYSEYSLLKYDTASKAFRFGDVLNLTHPATDEDWQKSLFEHALDRRFGNVAATPANLAMVAANARLRQEAESDPSVLLNADRLKEAGFTWEDTLSLAGDRLDKARLWEAAIPSMGLFALLRNLRNFDEAGVSDTTAETAAERLTDSEQVRRSRLMPMRFLSAYRAAPSLRWSWPLEQALDASVANIPALSGRTLVLVDTSGSMNSPFSRDGSLMRWDAAVVFALALATRCDTADVVSFSSGWHRGPDSLVFPHKAGESVLAGVERWTSDGYFLNGGTDTAGAVKRHYNGHDRVVILTDEQAHWSHAGDVTAAVPARVPVYTWNLAGHRVGHAPSGERNRHTFGGLSDKAFAMISLLEQGKNATWPF